MKPLRRPRTRRQAGPRVIIACEGEACEPGYFRAICKERRLSEDRILILPPAGTDPDQIVRAARRAVDDAVRERSWDQEMDQAWAVFDVDDKKRDKPGKWNTAKQLAGKKVRLAVSNPAFELWYLLHFQEQRAELTRQRARQLLGTHTRQKFGQDYDKAAVLYPHIREATEEAIQRAQELSVMHARDRPEEDDPNPNTGIWELVAHLLTLGPV